MDNKVYIMLIIALGVSLSFFLYYVFSPTKEVEPFRMSSDSNIDPKLREVLNVIGGDILAVTPKSRHRKMSDKRMEDLFAESANPWNVSMMEFYIIRVAFAIAGGVVGSFIGIIMYGSWGLKGILTVGLLGIFLGQRQPIAIYQEAAEKRTLEFKTQLPEALDYLALVMEAGSHSLAEAFRLTARYLPEGVIKEEFDIVIDNLDSGSTMDFALKNMAERAPHEGVTAFVNSMNSANKLSVPMADLIRQRSTESRKEYEAEVDRKIQAMPTKLMLLLSPTAIISLMIIIILPVAKAFL